MEETKLCLNKMSVYKQRFSSKGFKRLTIVPQQAKTKHSTFELTEQQQIKQRFTLAF